jgi:hypothetical protein
MTGQDRYRVSGHVVMIGQDRYRVFMYGMWLWQAGQVQGIHVGHVVMTGRTGTGCSCRACSYDRAGQVQGVHVGHVIMTGRTGTGCSCRACGYDRAGQVQSVHVKVYQCARHHIAILARPLQTLSSKIRFSNVSHLKPIAATDGHYSDHCSIGNGLPPSLRTQITRRL